MRSLQEKRKDLYLCFCVSGILPSEMTAGEKPSKTQRKQKALSAQELGEKLVKLTAEQQTGKFDLPEDLQAAVALARKITNRGALNRQMQYIGALMRKIDTAPIREALQDLEDGNKRPVERHKEAEALRDELISADEEMLGALLGRLPETERAVVADLVAKARQEKTEANPSPAPARALFRHLYKSGMPLPPKS
jgi:ribosome-associated protein